MTSAGFDLMAVGAFIWLFLSKIPRQSQCEVQNKAVDGLQVNQITVS